MIDHPTAPDDLESLTDAADAAADEGSRIEVIADDITVDIGALFPPRRTDPDVSDASPEFFPGRREQQRDQLINLLFAPIEELPAGIVGPRTRLFAGLGSQDATPSDIAQADAGTNALREHAGIVLERGPSVPIAFVPAEPMARRSLRWRALAWAVMMTIVIAALLGLWSLIGSPATSASPTTVVRAISTTAVTTTTQPAVRVTTATSLAAPSTSAVSVPTDNSLTSPPATAGTRRPATTTQRRTTQSTTATTVRSDVTVTTDGGLVVPPSVSVPPSKIFEPDPVASTPTTQAPVTQAPATQAPATSAPATAASSSPATE